MNFLAILTFLLVAFVPVVSAGFGAGDAIALVLGLVILFVVICAVLGYISRR